MKYILTGLMVALATTIPISATVDAGLLALVPSGVKVIGGVDAQRARNSPLGQHLLSRINTNSQPFEDMISQTGFDPRRDVQEVLFGSSAPGDSKSSGFVLVRGNFDQDRIRTAAKARGVSITSYQGVDLFTDGSSKNQNAFAFPDVDMAVAGDLASVQQVLQNRANPTTLDPAFQQLVTNAGTNSDAWFASIAPGSFLGNELRHESTARVQPNAMLIAPALENMNVQTNGSTVHISVVVPEKTMEQLMDKSNGKSIIN